MPSFDSSLELAAQALAGCPAHLKHIVVISDGDAAQPNPGLVARIVKNRITVSAVCVVPHDDNGAVTMAALARWGKGRFYLLKPGEVEALPRIFVKEATTLRRNAIRRKPFVPLFSVAVQDLPPALKGFGGALPSLAAHTLVETKERAEAPIVTPDGDPVLAFWRYGLGETAAFTSAMQSGWIGDWAAWDGLDRFWSQVVRSVFRKAGRSGFLARASVEGGVATVRVSARSEAGEDLDFLEFEGFAVHPEGETRSFPVVQKGSGTYEGSFPVPGDGTSVAVLRYRLPGAPGYEQLEVPVSVSYPEEYSDLETNMPLLARLQDESGARLITGEEDVFAGESVAGVSDRPLAQLLLLLAALLLPVDVFFRRTRVRPGKLFRRFVPPIPARKAKKRKPAPAAAGEPVPDAPEGPERELPEEPGRPAVPKGRKDEEKKDHIEDLLAAKKRAKRKRRWEDT
jgi:hypothetical protein